MREGGGGEKEAGIWGNEGGESPCQRGRKRQKVNTTRLVLSLPPSCVVRLFSQLCTISSGPSVFSQHLHAARFTTTQHQQRPQTWHCHRPFVFLKLAETKWHEEKKNCQRLFAAAEVSRRHIWRYFEISYQMAAMYQLQCNPLPRVNRAASSAAFAGDKLEEQRFIVFPGVGAG